MPQEVRLKNYAVEMVGPVFHGASGHVPSIAKWNCRWWV